MALWRDGRAESAVYDDPRSHAERLPVEALTWLGGLGITLAAVDSFAVVAGPGSFTGLRVGVAATQGWAFAAGKPVIAVPTLDAVASDRGTDGRTDVLVVPMIDGQRSEIFFSAWRNGIELLPAAAARPEEAIAAVVAAFPGESVVAIGDGLDKYGGLVAAAGWSRRETAAPLAESAVRLAASGRYPLITPHAVRPIYVRRPDAETARQRRDRAQ